LLWRVLAKVLEAGGQCKARNCDNQEPFHACASHSSISFTMSPMSQSRSVTRAAIAGEMRTLLLIRAKYTSKCTARPYERGCRSPWNDRLSVGQTASSADAWSGYAFRHSWSKQRLLAALHNPALGDAAALAGAVFALRTSHIRRRP
jgi:hypothetical protein